MDREKDIGPIYNLYEDKNEKYSNKNINNNANDKTRNNENRINDIENSITASLISENKKTIMCNSNNERQMYVSLLILIFALGLFIVGVYFLVIQYNK